MRLEACAVDSDTLVFDALEQVLRCGSLNAGVFDVVVVVV